MAASTVPQTSDRAPAITTNCRVTPKADSRRPVLSRKTSTSASFVPVDAGGYLQASIFGGVGVFTPDLPRVASNALAHEPSFSAAVKVSTMKVHSSGLSLL